MYVYIYIYLLCSTILYKGAPLKTPQMQNRRTGDNTNRASLPYRPQNCDKKSPLAPEERVTSLWLASKKSVAVKGTSSGDLTLAFLKQALFVSQKTNRNIDAFLGHRNPPKRIDQTLSICITSTCTRPKGVPASRVGAARWIMLIMLCSLWKFLTLLWKMT